MRSQLLTNSSTLPTAGSHSPVRNDYSTAMHRSIARYLNSQADRSMFRENVLIDPHTQSLKETKERYVSPYNRGILGDISHQNHIPDLKLNLSQNTKAKHEQNIARVDKNVLNVQSRKDAISYFAKKFEDKLKRKSLQVVNKANENSSFTRRNNQMKSHYILQTCTPAVESVFQSASRSPEKSARKESVTNIRQKSIDHHEKLSKRAAAEQTNRSTFLKFMNKGETSEQSAREMRIEPKKALNRQFENLVSQSVTVLPALNFDSRRESKVDNRVTTSCLGALGKWTSTQVSSKENSKERQDYLNKKISQHSFEDIYLQSCGQYIEPPPKMKRIMKPETNTRFNDSQVSKLFPLIARNVSNAESRNFKPEAAQENNNEQDLVEFEDDRITPKQGLQQQQPLTVSVSHKKSDSKMTEPTLFESQYKKEQLAPYDRYGSVVAKNMMKMQRRYRVELQPQKKLVAHSMRVLLPPKKLKKSPKFDRVDLVADIETAYGKAFGTDIQPSEQSIANRPSGGGASDKLVNKDLSNINNSSQYQSSMTVASSALKTKKPSGVLSQIQNQINNRSFKVNKIAKKFKQEIASPNPRRLESHQSEIMLRQSHN